MNEWVDESRDEYSTEIQWRAECGSTTKPWVQTLETLPKIAKQYYPALQKGKYYHLWMNQVDTMLNEVSHLQKDKH
jgi:hypothetical protein